MDYRDKLIKLLSELEAQKKSPYIAKSIRDAIQEIDKSNKNSYS